jgi:hypothetical protein
MLARAIAPTLVDALNWEIRNNENEEVAMICPSIIIFEEYDDTFDEAEKIRKSLEEITYADRRVTTFLFDPNKGDNAFVKTKGDDKPKEGHEDAGIYVIAHGAEGSFNNALISLAAAERLAAKLLWLVDRGFKIKKLSFITCSGVEMTGDEENPQPVPEDLGKGNISVQKMCRVISTADNSQKLNGLMVAGYHKGAYLTDDPSHRHPIKTRQGGNIEHRIRPKLMDGEKPTPKLPSKLKTYAKHKIIFVLQDGKWRFGKLSEYSDRAEWKDALTTRGL